MKKYILSGLVTLLLVSPVVAKTLTADEIRDQVIGKTMKFVTKDGYTGKVKHSSNGKSRLSNTNFDPKSDRGSWRIKGNRLCSSWTIIRGGKEKCFSYTKTGDRSFKGSDGSKLTY